MKTIIDINTGEVKVAKEPVMLRSIAIGSCIVVAAMNFERKIGAMAHIMLPGKAESKAAIKTRYAVDAIDELIRMMNGSEHNTIDIEACLVGAGNILKKPDDTICQANISSATQILKEKDIPVRASVLGGTERKSVFMDIEKGRISFTRGNDGEKTLWQVGQL